ncbi:a-factor receptor [Malassezia cuniculi]|uniref:A-factor receptor n=1 Tax=Malassezia cuniculi TaxID=948313 RepID=A0AAF0ERG5_9BASI|nr:a-factor receptor [Malassezia cuniculi]
MGGVILAACALLVAVLVLLPAPSHWRAKNASIILLILWLSIGNIITFFNRALWMNDYRNKAPVWCDVSIKLSSAVSIGIPCATACIARRLYLISRPSVDPPVAQGKRAQITHEILLCGVVPFAYAILTLVNQGHRFNIVEGIGCQPVIYLSPVSILIDYGTPLCISIISIVYSFLGLGNFLIRKSNFDSILERSGTGINIAKFLRAILFTIIDLLLLFPIFLAEFSIQLIYGRIKPYSSWESVHAGFSNVVILTKSMLDNSIGRRCIVLANLSSWALCLSALVFFILFGFNVDARHGYSRAVTWFKSILKSDSKGGIAGSEKINCSKTNNDLEMNNDSDRSEEPIGEDDNDIDNSTIYSVTTTKCGDIDSK